MGTPFKLKSGNTSSFKNLGSSPVKQIPTSMLGRVTKAFKNTPKQFAKNGKEILKTTNRNLVSGGKQILKAGGKSNMKAKTNTAIDWNYENKKLQGQKFAKSTKKTAKKKVAKKIAGKALSRAIPGVGWGLAAYDAGKFATDWYQTGSAKKAWKKMWE
jgi:hypothetical protein